MWRIGTGFDVPALVEGRPLILGGLDIPHEKGLQGHSDADVLLHAVMDDESPTHDLSAAIKELGKNAFNESRAAK